MNYLAHALLAGPDLEFRLGGLLGDFVKGSPASFDSRLTDATIAGIRLHRGIDSFADGHSAFRTSRGRISTRRRRFAGVMIDMFYDHFLARSWDRFSTQPLPRFTADTYALLARHGAILPPRLAAILPRMQTDDWLGGYADCRSIAAAIDAISRHRLRSPNALAGGAEELLQHYAALEADFHVFMLDAVAYAQRWREEHPRIPGGPLSGHH